MVGILLLSVLEEYSPDHMDNSGCAHDLIICFTSVDCILFYVCILLALVHLHFAPYFIVFGGIYFCCTLFISISIEKCCCDYICCSCPSCPHYYEYHER